MVAAKPDITGQRFGRLVVIGKAQKSRWRGGKNGSLCYPWRLKCDCGKEIELFRSDFTRKNHPQRSCGCLYRETRHAQKPSMQLNLVGQRFGELVVLEMLPGGLTPEGRRVRSKALCLCDCGTQVKIAACNLKKSLQRKVSYLNCKGRQHLVGAWYPPMPTPPPPEVFELFAKYQRWADYTIWLERKLGHSNSFVDTRIQDLKRERLERCCWIVVYRRRQGEEITPLHEARYIWKSLRDLWREPRQSTGYNANNQIQLGDCMARELGTTDGTKMTVSEILLPAPKKLSYSRR